MEESCRNQGFAGLGVDFLFLENIIYFCAILINVFVDCYFVFFFFFFKRCCTPWKQNEGHSQRSRCRKHPIVLRYHVTVWVCVCVCVGACVHTSRCNMELLLAMKERFACHFWGVLIKKKRPSSISARLPRPPVCVKVGGGQKWNRVSYPVGSDTGVSCRLPGNARKLEQLRFENVPSRAVGLSGRPGQRHKTTAGHQHCNFLTYNKAISYFLPYKWK